MATVPGLLAMTDELADNAGLTISVDVAELTVTDERGGSLLLTEDGG